MSNWRERRAVQRAVDRAVDRCGWYRDRAGRGERPLGPEPGHIDRLAPLLRPVSRPARPGPPPPSDGAELVCAIGRALGRRPRAALVVVATDRVIDGVIDRPLRSALGFGRRPVRWYGFPGPRPPDDPSAPDWERARAAGRGAVVTAPSTIAVGPPGWSRDLLDPLGLVADRVRVVDLVDVGVDTPPAESGPGLLRVPGAGIVATRRSPQHAWAPLPGRWAVKAAGEGVTITRLNRRLPWLVEVPVPVPASSWVASVSG